MAQEESNNNQSSQMNKYYTSTSALQIRLDTSHILEKMYSYLSGTVQIVKYVDEDEDPVVNDVVIGEPKANKNGIQSIMSWFQSLINTAVVQGNFDKEQYSYFIWEKRRELAKELVLNKGKNRWNINSYEISGIVSIAMNLIEPFFSRTIDNKERDSYSDTIRTIESNSVQQRGNGLFR